MSADRTAISSKASFMLSVDVVPCRLTWSLFLGCYRNPSWPWWRLPLPWWTLFILVPVYSLCSSLANLQAWRSIQLPIMVLFSCLAYAANRGANQLLSDRGDIVSSFGALVIGLCGNIYSRVIGGTAFTSMVTGVLFIVPVSLDDKRTCVLSLTHVHSYLTVGDW